MLIHEFLSLFENPKRSGDGWVVLCPAHDDRHESLSVGEGEDRRILLNCHAGCAVEEVVAARGLRMADLMPGRAQPTAGREVAYSDYRDEKGEELLFQSVRYEPKGFRQRRPDGRGGWLWNMKGVRRVPYRLSELRGHPTVYIVEGEKDVDTLCDLGIVATTNIGGAGKWTQDLTRQLCDAGVEQVVVIPDNDEPGQRHALSVAEYSRASGLGVRILELPDLPLHGDVSDWLVRGNDRAKLEQLAAGAPDFQGLNGSAPLKTPDVRLVSLPELLSRGYEPVSYLIHDRVPVGGLVMIAGKPKSGKSTFARALAFEVARGGRFMGAECQQASVLYVALEDKESEVRGHFHRMGASDEPLTFLFPQPMQDPVSQLLQLANQRRPGLIIVDTLQRLIRARDLNDYAEVTTKLTPLLAIARETGAAVLLIHHAGKADRAGADGVLGSTALHGSVDNTLMIKRDSRFRTIWSEQRIGPDLEETVIILNPETGLIELGDSRADADLAVVKAELCSAIAGLLEPAVEKDVQQLISGRNAVKVAALRGLVADGRVTKCGLGGPKDPFRYFLSPAPLSGGSLCTDVPNVLSEQGNKAEPLSTLLGG